MRKIEAKQINELVKQIEQCKNEQVKQELVNKLLELLKNKGLMSVR